MTSGDKSGAGSEDTTGQLRKLEESLLDVSVHLSPEKLRCLLAEDFREFGSSGRCWTRDSVIEMLPRETAFLPAAIENFRCDLLADDVALVTYRTVLNDPVSGKLLSSLRSSIWTRDSGVWRMRFHQGTRTKG